jgi:hypothetical protein
MQIKTTLILLLGCISITHAQLVLERDINQAPAGSAACLFCSTQ